MSREVDERIVAMYFDNKDFEKNAQSTIKTLDELKKGLDLEGAAKGLDSLQKAGKSLNFDRANQSVKTFRNTLSGLSDIARKVTGNLTSPLNSLASAFDAFQGYVGKVVGFDIAGKLVGGIESALRQVTIEPIAAGWSEYELKMDSIKTIMSGSGESLEVVKDKLEELNQYADKTIYSFSDMTSNIGKFTNNGVKLDEATAAIKGIANAAADAGQGAQQASMAMYNISQALGVGSMKLVDWKSIENANMATSRLKNTFLKLGGALGQLKQYTDKEGNIHYFAAEDKNAKKINSKKIAGMTKSEVEAYLKRLSAEEITAENFRESLNKDWLNKEVLLKTLQVFSGDELDMDTIMSWGFDEETARELMKIGEEASKAATEVRTFSKMWDALKESAQSGWAQSIEFIFGDMEEGTKLWTELNKILDGVISGSAENRNNLLMSWRGMERMDDNTIRKIEGATDGRERLIEGMRQIIYTFQDLGRAWSSATEAVFGHMTGEKLLQMTEGFRSMAYSVRNWLGVVTKSDSRLSKLRQGLQGVFSIIKTGINFLKIGANLIKRLATPALDVLINLFGKFGEFFDGMGDLNPGQVFSKIGDGIGKLWTKLKSLFTVGENGTTPISSFLSKLWTDLKTVVRSWADANGLGGVLDGVKSVWSTVTEWQGWTDISNAFLAAKKAVTDAWNTLDGWSGWEEVGRFFTNIWEWFTRKIGGGDSSPTQSSSELKAATEETVHAIMGVDSNLPAGGKTGFVTWLESVGGALKRAWDTIATWPEWEKIGKFFSDIGGWLAEVWNTTINWFTRPTENGKTGFSEWLGNVWETIKTVWTDITENGKAIWEGISSFVSDTMGWLMGNKEEDPAARMMRKQGKITSTAENPVTAYLRVVWESVKNIWSEISEAGKSVWEGISKFVSNIWGWIMGLGGEGGNAGEVPVSKIAENAPTQEEVSVLQTVLTSFSDFWTQVSTFAEKVATNPVLDRIWTTVEKTVEIIGTLIGAIVDVIHGAVVEGDFGSYAIIGGIGAIYAVINGFGATVKTKNLKNMATIAENSQSIGLQILEIAGAMALIATAVSVMTTIDADKLWTAIKQMGVIGAIIGALTIAIHQFGSNKVEQNTPTTALERIASSIVKYLGVAAVIGVAMKGLPEIIKAFSETKDVDGDAILKSMLGLVALIGGVGILFAALDKITGGKGMSVTATATTAASVVAAIAILMTGLGAIFTFQGGIVTMFGEQNVDDAVRIIENGGKIFAAVGEAISNFFKALFGGGTDEGKRRQAEEQLNWLDKMSDSMDSTRLLKIGNMLTLVDRISDLKYDARNMDLMAEQLPDVGNGLAKFAAVLEKITVGENADQRVNNLMKMMQVLDAFANTMRAITDAYYIQAYADQFGDDTLSSLFELYSGAAARLAQAIQDGLGEEGELTFNAMPIIDSIIASLNLGSEAIAKAVHEMVQQGINLSENATGGGGYVPPSDTAELLNSLLNGTNLDSFDTSGYEKALYGEDGKGGIIGSLSASLEDLKGMDSFGEILSDKMTIPEASEGLTEITGYLTELQSSLDGMSAFEVKITPVFSMDRLGRQNLEEMLNREIYGVHLPGIGANFSFDGGAIVTAVQGVSGKIDALMARVTAENIMNRTKIGEMGERIDRVSSSVQKMRVVLDSGALVGEIAPGVDYSLGERAVVSSRTGVSPKWGNIPTYEEP